MHNLKATDQRKKQRISKPSKKSFSSPQEIQEWRRKKKPNQVKKEKGQHQNMSGNENTHTHTHTYKSSWVFYTLSRTGEIKNPEAKSPGKIDQRGERKRESLQEGRRQIGGSMR